jgi:hypothetical protein
MYGKYSLCRGKEIIRRWVEGKGTLKIKKIEKNKKNRKIFSKMLDKTAL